jgi:hypothetical protein
MRKEVCAAVALRESERQEIANQVKAFMARGGAIERLPVNISAPVKTPANIRRVANVRSFEDF